MVRTLAVDYARHGVRVNAIVPGPTETPSCGPTCPPTRSPRRARRSSARSRWAGSRSRGDRRARALAAVGPLVVHDRVARRVRRRRPRQVVDQRMSAPDAPARRPGSGRRAGRSATAGSRRTARARTRPSRATRACACSTPVPTTRASRSGSTSPTARRPAVRRGGARRAGAPRDAQRPRRPRARARGTDYSAVVVASAPVVVQHTRLDSRQAANALFSTIAHPVDTFREDLR